MRVKTVPPPPANYETVFDARSAVPLVPKPEGDCCARLVDRLDLPSRDEARTWLTFLRGLGLVRRTERGFVRNRDEVSTDALADRLVDGVFGAREVLAVVDSADEPLEGDDVFERFERHVPVWERHKQPGAWREGWRERVGDVLDWLVLLDLLEYGDGRYARA